MIEVRHLYKSYRLSKKTSIFALKDIHFAIERGEVLALVGESGSGKSTLGKILLGLLPPTSGEIYFEGKKKVGFLPRRIQMIFQDPYSSLNPRQKIGSILKEPTLIHGLDPRVEELLDLVHLSSDLKERYPHELSGGQRQRVAIARALALQPDFLICDEPTSALDLSIQAQIINLLKELQREFQLTLLFISHDLALVHYIANRVAVMKEGAILEIGEGRQLFANPRHSYTQSLIRCLSVSEPDR